MWQKMKERLVQLALIIQSIYKSLKFLISGCENPISEN